MHVATHLYGEKQLVFGGACGGEGGELGVWQVVDGGGASQCVVGYPQGHRAAEGALALLYRQALVLQSLSGHRRECVCVCVCVYVCDVSFSFLSIGYQHFLNKNVSLQDCVPVLMACSH